MIRFYIRVQASLKRLRYYRSCICYVEPTFPQILLEIGYGFWHSRPIFACGEVNGR